MEQPDGYCYAVDFGLIGRGITTWEVNNIAKHYGLYPTVDSEWWHHQPRDGDDWFKTEGIVESDEIKREPRIDWLGIVRMLNNLKEQIKVSPIRYKERSGRVKILQKRLGTVGMDAGVPDGIFGRGTRKAVKRFQRSVRLRPDGIVGPMTWKALWGNN